MQTRHIHSCIKQAGKYESALKQKEGERTVPGLKRKDA
jgi:hypothetical protein